MTFRGWGEGVGKQDAPDAGGLPPSLPSSPFPVEPSGKAAALPASAVTPSPYAERVK